MTGVYATYYNDILNLAFDQELFSVVAFTRYTSWLAKGLRQLLSISFHISLQGHSYVIYTKSFTKTSSLWKLRILMLILPRKLSSDYKMVLL